MALTKKAVAEMTLRLGEDIPVPQHLVVGFDSLWVHDGSHILGSVLQGHSVPSYIQRKKRKLIVTMSKSKGSYYLLGFKFSKAVYPSFQIRGLCLPFF